MFGKMIDKLTPANLWLMVGFIGQFFFCLRFVVQWIATEKAKKSVIPLAFWYLSLVGTLILLAYSIYKKDPVFIAGFSLNLIIYMRNLYFIHIHPRKCAAPEKEPAANDQQ